MTGTFLTFIVALASFGVGASVLQTLAGQVRVPVRSRDDEPERPSDETEL